MTASVRLGLTGGIGSGKSTVAAILSKCGAFVIDADAISRATTAPQGIAIQPIEAQFGSTLLTEEGALDREKMRRLVYADASAKALLEGILHPLVGQEISRQAGLAEQQGSVCTVFDIPLLVESKHWRAMLQRILVVDCLPTTQIARVVARNSLPVADIRNILKAQATREERLRAADLVLFNDGITMDALAIQVQKIGTQFGL